jgi:CubicO group peptidase (beta-lactamase class C family)
MEWASHDYAVQDLIDAFKDRPPSFSPGEKNAYSNSNYILLGAIIEKVSGLTFGRFVETSVFGPLGMKSTFCGGVLQDVPRLATAYEPARTAGDQLDWSRLLVARPHTLSSVYAAGGCVSSVPDFIDSDALRKARSSASGARTELQARRAGAVAPPARCRRVGGSSTRSAAIRQPCVGGCRCAPGSSMPDDSCRRPVE